MGVQAVSSVSLYGVEWLTKNFEFTWCCSKFKQWFYASPCKASFHQYLEGLVERTPDLYLAELQHELLEARGIRCWQDHHSQDTPPARLFKEKGVCWAHWNIEAHLLTLGYMPCTGTEWRSTSRISNKGRWTVPSWAACLSWRVGMQPEHNETGICMGPDKWACSKARLFHSGKVVSIFRVVHWEPVFMSYAMPR